MSDTPSVVYVPRPDATPESEVSVLANVYAYLIKTHDSKKAAEPTQSKTSKANNSIRRKEAEMP
jgi:hypothetical protein